MPRSTIHGCATSCELLNLGESPFPHVCNEYDDAYLARLIERLEMGSAE